MCSGAELGCQVPGGDPHGSHLALTQPGPAGSGGPDGIFAAPAKQNCRSRAVQDKGRRFLLVPSSF